jgi:beta-phosphoglucomutase-like phosphatase (HAD superfamily)
MHPTLNIQALLLDLDGLLIDSEPIYRFAWQSAAAGLGYEISDDLYLNLIGLSDRDSEEVLIRIFGPKFPLAQFRSLWPVRWRCQVDAFGIPAKPGLWNFLKVIEKRRLPAAVATSSDAGQVRMSLQAAGLNQRFSCIVTGDQVPKGKPAPDIFLEAARRLGSLPRHCLVLEDSEAGVLAATAAGMPVLLIPDLKQPSPSTAALAYRVFPSLKEATDFVERAFDE